MDKTNEIVGLEFLDLEKIVAKSKVNHDSSMTTTTAVSSSSVTDEVELDNLETLRAGETNDSLLAK